MPTTNHADTTAGKDPKTASSCHLSKDGSWRYFTKIPYLRQYVPTGTYFARIKRDGKSIRKSLDTDVFSVAKLRLPDLIKTLRKPRTSIGTFGEAAAQYETSLKNDHTIGEVTKKYRRDCLKVLRATWPGVDVMDISKISEGACKEWSTRFIREGYSEQYFNNVLGTLKRILSLGGLRGEDNPTTVIKRLGIKPKELTLPDREQFREIVKAVAMAGSRHSRHCANLIQFLSYTGCRISEARQVKWKDVDFKRGDIRVENAKRSKRSNAQRIRQIPINSDLLKLLVTMKEEYRQISDAVARLEPDLQDRVCLVGECEKSLTNACKNLGIARITHHDLRHLFATRCIESGIDIPTISRWLGHQDGGVLAMRTYGHLQRDHSAAMARRLTFAPVENAVQIPLAIAEGVAS